MTDNSWVMDIEDKIYTIIKAKTEKKIKTKYSDAYFTMTDATLTKPMFPTIFVKFLPSVEVGNDLEGTEINAIYMTIQIEITVSATQDMQTARWINGTITSAMKSMHFMGDNLGGFETAGVDTRTIISRYGRTLGCDEPI